mmetsp:Transcript_88673/g.194299  ORF Transcript_88673/g.194299 Transcript_88673/m.194299 type:complete len:267 (-) Transcript_88673:995-1795(-)
MVEEVHCSCLLLQHQPLYHPDLDARAGVLFTVHTGVLPHGISSKFETLPLRLFAESFRDPILPLLLGLCQTADWPAFVRHFWEQHDIFGQSLHQPSRSRHPEERHRKAWSIHRQVTRNGGSLHRRIFDQIVDSLRSGDPLGHEKCSDDEGCPCLQVWSLGQLPHHHVHLGASHTVLPHQLSPPEARKVLHCLRHGLHLYALRLAKVGAPQREDSGPAAEFQCAGVLMFLRKRSILGVLEHRFADGAGHEDGRSGEDHNAGGSAGSL